jgi:hypothetical protein
MGIPRFMRSPGLPTHARRRIRRGECGRAEIAANLTPAACGAEVEQVTAMDHVAALD